MSQIKPGKNLLWRMLNRTGKVRFNLSITPSRSKELQLRTLKKLLSKAKYTEFGRAHDFEKILQTEDLYKAFNAHVAMGDYLNMLPWWKKMREGRSDITWPGRVEHFALSSGTSDGSSKFIPVTAEMLKFIRRASLRQIVAIAATDVPKDHLTKHWLMIGGSTALDFNGIYYSGDLSGITTSNIPAVFQRISKPEPEIRSSKDWQEKIQRITLEAGNWDVGMIAGIPAWIQLLFENIISHYKLQHIHEIWPNLEVFVHGGVSLKPYQKSIDALLGRPIKYFETYLASEGFIALQTRQGNAGGMRMLLRGGIFYEFIPFNEENFTDVGELRKEARAIPIWEVEQDKEYVLLLSTCAGAWRYLIGDTIRFTNLKKNEIVITGRTKHFISLCGEHLSVDNMNEALKVVGDHYGIAFNEFTVGAVHSGQLFGHLWFLPEERKGLSTERLAIQIDEALSKLNDDYAIERRHALQQIRVELVPPDSFLKWMTLRKRLGAQSKFPRVMRGKMLEDWSSFLRESGVEVKEFTPVN